VGTGLRRHRSSLRIPTSMLEGSFPVTALLCQLPLGQFIPYSHARSCPAQPLAPVPPPSPSLPCAPRGVRDRGALPQEGACHPLPTPPLCTPRGLRERGNLPQEGPCPRREPAPFP